MFGAAGSSGSFKASCIPLDNREDSEASQNTMRLKARLAVDPACCAQLPHLKALWSTTNSQGFLGQAM